MSCKMDKILKVCNENKLKLIEDAAHASGTKFQNKKIGTHGMAVCFSFHPVKNLAMPTGGLISLNGEMSSKNEQDIKSRRWCGISNRKGTTYDVKELGWNYYMNEFSATIGLEQLRKLDRLNSIRKKIAKRFFDEIKFENKMQFEKDCSYHFYWIRVKKRPKFIDFMKNHKIETGIHYKPIHKMSMYSNKMKLKVTDKIANDIVSLPTHPNLSQDDISIYGKILFVDFMTNNSLIFTKGHRTPLGLYSDEKVVLSTENGPRGGDEINKIIFKANYGWPISSYGEKYSVKSNKPTYLKDHVSSGYEEPLFAFVPAIGISEIIKLPNEFSNQFIDNFIISSLWDSSLYRIKFDENFNRIIFMEKIFVGQRIRDIKYSYKINAIILALEEKGELGIIFNN